MPDHARGRLPTALEAAAVRPGPGGGDLARIDALDADRMHDSLVFLASYAPGVLDVILTATEPAANQDQGEGRDRDCLVDHDRLEPYCTQCGSATGIFTGRGNDWLHYSGRPETADVRPYAADHHPVIGWRIAASPIAEVAR